MTDHFEAALARSLTDMFPAEELYRLVRHHVAGELASDLPPHDRESRKAYAGKIAEWLLERGLATKPFFAAWREERPDRTEEIQALEDRAPEAGATRCHRTGKARTQYLESIVTTEQERHTLDAIFTSVSATGAVVPLRDVYIPPRLTQRSLAGSEKSYAPDPEGSRDDTRLPLVEWLCAVAEDHKLLIVVGEMGSGKTELLHQARHELAMAAMDKARAPLPILIRARDLASGAPNAQKLAIVASRDLALQAENLRKLLEDESTRWIYLIDGLDEADPATWKIVRALTTAPHCRTVRVVATTRPASPPGSLQTVLEMSPWTPTDGDLFLERWQALDPEAVRVLRESSAYRAARDEFMTNPLTATLALAVASRGGAIPHSRARLFGEIVDILAQEWSRTRGPDSLHWAQVAPVLQRVALRYLQERLPHVPRELLLDELERIAPDGALELERDTERRFGVLVRLDGGRGHDFLLRGIAEHLAGRALLKRGFDAIIEASHEAWAEEPVRHAMGLADKRDAMLILRRLLLDGWPKPLPAEVWLRPLLIAIRACSDFRSLPAKATRTLCRAIRIALLEEESSWLGDRVADAVRVLAASGNSLMKELWQICFKRLMNPIAQPVTWYASLRGRSATWWLRGLRHRDANVRALACRRLAAHVNDADPKRRAEVRGDLVLTLLDEGFFSPPALVAGQALRGANRDRDFEHIRATLLDLLESGEQFSAGGAALALRPDEADPRALVRALYRADEGHRMIAGPLRELAATPGGREALDEIWPDWAERQDEEWPMMPFHQANTSGENPGPRPPSSHVRRRILRAFAPGFHHLDREEVQKALAHAGDAVIDDLCRALYHSPDEFLPYLRLGERTDFFLYIETQHELGRAAMKHPQVRDALLNAWDPDDRRLHAAYPGAALEPLVRRGDERAVEVYASWLRVPNDTVTWQQELPPDPVVFDVPEVAEAALERVRDAWEYATRGRYRDGQRTYLAPQTASSVLGHFWPVWIRDSRLVDELLQWLEGDETEKVSAALWAFTRGPLRGTTRFRVENVLITLLDRCKDPSSLAPEQSFHASRWLRSAEFLELPHADPLLRAIVSRGSGLSALAAAILLPSLTDSEDRQQVASTVAQSGVLPFGNFLLERHRRALIQAAPDAWFEAVAARIRDSEGWSHQIVLRLLPILPDEHREKLARLLHDKLEDEDLDLPWLRMGDWMGPIRYWRPADALSQIFFDAGLTAPLADADSDDDPGLHSG